MFDDIGMLLHERFLFVQMCFFIKRTKNSSAHKLARIGMSLEPGHEHVWTDPLPIFVNVHVTRDSAEFSVLIEGHRAIIA